MKKKSLRKNKFARQSATLFERKLKKEDLLELPMDEKFFEDMQQRIMSAIEKTEIKPISRWSKTWVFLETKAKPHRSLAKKAIKTSFFGFALSLALGLACSRLKMMNDVNQSMLTPNRQIIIQEAQQNPTLWNDLVVNYQYENDFYADVLSRQADQGMQVLVDRVLIESL